MFNIVSVDPVKRIPMWSWYRTESATSIITRLQPTSPWQVHEVLLDGDRLSWTSGGRTYALRRVLPQEYPDWLGARIATIYSKMDAIEECA